MEILSLTVAILDFCVKCFTDTIIGVIDINTEKNKKTHIIKNIKSKPQKSWYELK